jgi:hypothetical protein
MGAFWITALRNKVPVGSVERLHCRRIHAADVDVIVLGELQLVIRLRPQRLPLLRPLQRLRRELACARLRASFRTCPRPARNRRPLRASILHAKAFIGRFTRADRREVVDASEARRVAVLATCPGFVSSCSSDEIGSRQGVADRLLIELGELGARSIWARCAWEITALLSLGIKLVVS